MNIKNIKIIKSDERGIMYDCGAVKFLSRKKGTISADHCHDDCECLYLVKGEAEFTCGKDVKTVKAPVKIEIERNVYHKLKALCDIEIIEDRRK
ncbi:MAG: hypothetical protein ABIC82_00610 [bacterium]